MIKARLDELLRQHDFRLFWTGETVNGAGNAMATVAMPLLAIKVLHVSTFMVGLLTACAYLPWLVVGLPAGALIDRLPSRKVMLTCDVVASALYASVAVAAWLGILRFGYLLAIACLAGVASVLFFTGYLVQLPTMVPPDRLIEGNVRLQASVSISQVSGPGLSGLVVQALGAASALMFNAASFLISAICLVRIRSPDRIPARLSGGMRQSVTRGLLFVGHDRYLRRIATWAAVSNLGFGGYEALVVLFLVRCMHLSSFAVGLLVTVTGSGAVAGALVANHVVHHLGSARALLAATTFSLPFGLLVLCTAPGPRLAFFVAGIIVAIGGISVANVIIASFRQSYAPPAILGAVTGAMRFLLMGTCPLGALLGGALGTWLGILHALWIMLGTVAVSGVCLLNRTFTARRDLPTVRTTGPARYVRPGTVLASMPDQTGMRAGQNRVEHACETRKADGHDGGTDPLRRAVRPRAVRLRGDRPARRTGLHRRRLPDRQGHEGRRARQRRDAGQAGHGQPGRGVGGGRRQSHRRTEDHRVRRVVRPRGPEHRVGRGARRVRRS
jgi:predicted MFS family arabinose efflux permease